MQQFNQIYSERIPLSQPRGQVCGTLPYTTSNRKSYSSLAICGQQAGPDKMVSPMTCCIPYRRVCLFCLATKQKHKNAKIKPVSAWKTHFPNFAVKAVRFLCEIERAGVGVYPLLPLHGVFAIGAGGIISLWKSHHILNIRGTCSPDLDYHSKGGSRSVFTLRSKTGTGLNPIHVGLKATTEAVTLKWTVSFHSTFQPDFTVSLI